MQWNYEPCLGRSTWLPGLFLCGEQAQPVYYLYTYKESILTLYPEDPKEGLKTYLHTQVLAAHLTTAESASRSEQMGSFQKGKYYSP